MQATMPKKQPQPKQNQFNVKLDDHLADALDAYLQAQRPRTYAPEVFRTALEDFLASKGYLPAINSPPVKKPKPPAKDSDD